MRKPARILHLFQFLSVLAFLPPIIFTSLKITFQECRHGIVKDIKLFFPGIAIDN